MAKCKYCGKESKFLFVCPKCDGRYCRDHRKPEDHNCKSLGEVIIIPKKEVIEIDKITLGEEFIETEILEELDILAVDDSFVEQETQVFEELIEEEETPSIDIEEDEIEDAGNIFESLLQSFKEYRKEIIIPLLIGIIIGIVLSFTIITLNPLKNDDNDLNAYYLELQTLFVNLTSEYEELKLRFFELEDLLNETENKLLQKTLEYNALYANYSLIAESENNWLNYLGNDLKDPKLPSINQLETWLENDETNSLSINSDFSELHYALIIALKARENHWKIGIISINGNFTSNEQTTSIFNTLVTSEGMIYLDPRTDNVWWYEKYEQITSGKLWEINSERIQVNEVKKIL